MILALALVLVALAVLGVCALAGAIVRHDFIA